MAYTSSSKEELKEIRPESVQDIQDIPTLKEIVDELDMLNRDPNELNHHVQVCILNTFVCSGMYFEHLRTFRYAF